MKTSFFSAYLAHYARFFVQTTSLFFTTTCSKLHNVGQLRVVVFCILLLLVDSMGNAVDVGVELVATQPVFVSPLHIFFIDKQYSFIDYQ